MLDRRSLIKNKRYSTGYARALNNSCFSVLEYIGTCDPQENFEKT